MKKRIATTLRRWADKLAPEPKAALDIKQSPLTLFKVAIEVPHIKPGVPASAGQVNYVLAQEIAKGIIHGSVISEYVQYKTNDRATAATLRIYLRLPI